MNYTVIEAALTYISDLFQGNADGHDAAHTLRVYRNALKLSKSISECDRFIVSVAALLHDADDHKLFPTENNANARSFLTAQKMPEDDIERIITIINEVSFSRNRGKKPSSIEAMVVQDADRLDAMGAIGVARTFAYGGEHGRSLDSSVQHFYDKLLLLKDEMNTEAAKTMAEERHRFMEKFLYEYKKEQEVPDAGS